MVLSEGRIVSRFENIFNHYCYPSTLLQLFSYVFSLCLQFSEYNMTEPTTSQSSEETLSTSLAAITLEGTDENLTKFQNIPKELVWNIIECTPSIVFDLRL